jgi:hypothetical protein
MDGASQGRKSAGKRRQCDGYSQIVIAAVQQNVAKLKADARNTVGIRGHRSILRHVHGALADSNTAMVIGLPMLIS